MATTTPNFGWDIPQSTDLVKDGATAIAALGTDIDTSLVDLKGGTTGQILSKNSNTDMDFTWITNDVGDITAVNAGTGISGGGSSGAVTITNDMATTITASGDIIVGTGSGSYDNLPIGTTGQVLTADTTVSPYKVKWAAIPSSGYVWTLRRQASTTSQINTIAYNGSNLYVAAGSGGILFSSSDGKTWTNRTSGFGSVSIQKVIYANSLWVAVGNSGTITTSSDGITWTARTSNMGSNTISDVHFANSLFVAVGNGGGGTNTGGIIYSSDGITWTRKSQTLSSVGANYATVVYNGSNWIVGANLGSSHNYLYASTPSGTWTSAQWGGGAISSNAAYFWYDGTRLISSFVGRNEFSYTTDATASAINYFDNVFVQNSSASGIRNSSSLYNGRLYIVNRYFSNFSTTPVNTNYSSDPGTLSISPMATQSPSTPFIDTSTPAILVTADGILIGGGYGQIYSSF